MNPQRQEASSIRLSRVRRSVGNETTLDVMSVSYLNSLAITMGDGSALTPGDPELSGQECRLFPCRRRMDLHRLAAVVRVGTPPTAIGSNLKR